MKYQLVYYSLLFTIAAGSIYVYSGFLKYIPQGTMRFNTNRYKEFSDFVKQQLEQEELNKVLKKSGFSINSTQYNLVRFAILALWLVSLAYQRLFLNEMSINQAIVWFAAYICTTPRQKLGSISTPFHMILNIFTERNRKLQDKEIYRAISQLKNLSISNISDNVSSDWIIEEIMKFTKHTKPVFAKMLKLWYESQQKQACEYFKEAIGTQGASELADLLLKLDNLSAKELKEQLILYQSNVKAERRTQANKKNEAKSDALYALVIVSAFFIMLNFIVVVILIDTWSTYQTMFK